MQVETSASEAGALCCLLRHISIYLYIYLYLQKCQRLVNQIKPFQLT